MSAPLQQRTFTDTTATSEKCHKLKYLAAVSPLAVTASNTGSETDRVWQPPPSDRLAPPGDLSVDVQPRRAERRCEIALPPWYALRHYRQRSIGLGLSTDKLPVSSDRCLCKHHRSIRRREY